MTSLPEGRVRQLLSQKLATQASSYLDDFQLLSVLGRHLIGRVYAIPQSSTHWSASTEIPSKELSYLLQKTGSTDIKQELFDSLLDFAGVSGGFDKVLASTPEHWIVKMDDDDHPALAVNEYLGIELCRAAAYPRQRSNSPAICTAHSLPDLISNPMVHAMALRVFAAFLSCIQILSFLAPWKSFAA
jgi:hypothetical protein